MVILTDMYRETTTQGRAITERPPAYPTRLLHGPFVEAFLVIGDIIDIAPKHRPARLSRAIRPL